MFLLYFCLWFDFIWWVNFSTMEPLSFDQCQGKCLRCLNCWVQKRRFASKKYWEEMLNYLSNFSWNKSQEAIDFPIDVRALLNVHNCTNCDSSAIRAQPTNLSDWPIRTCVHFLYTSKFERTVCCYQIITPRSPKQRSTGKDAWCLEKN